MGQTFSMCLKFRLVSVSLRSHRSFRTQLLFLCQLHSQCTSPLHRHLALLPTPSMRAVQVVEQSELTMEQPMEQEQLMEQSELQTTEQLELQTTELWEDAL